MADLPKHPSRVDEAYPSTRQSRLAYTKGRNIALAVCLPASALTAPFVLLSAAYAAADERYTTEGAGVFLLVCGSVTTAVVQGGAAIGLLVFALIRDKHGDPAQAKGLVRGWIYVATANVLIFMAAALVLRLTVYG